jgi:hypothetical protein
MKKLILCFIFLPFAGHPLENGKNGSPTSLIQVRSGNWPISLEREIEGFDTSYSLQFRDKQVLNAESLDTLPFADLTQLKYFQKALVALKNGNNGDIAKFRDYTIKRADPKKGEIWFLLRYKWSLTDFQQTEANLMINTIKGL